MNIEIPDIDPAKAIKVFVALMAAFMIRKTIRDKTNRSSDLDSLMNSNYDTNIKNLKEGSSCYARVQVVEAPSHTERVEIHYNQYYLIEPSDLPVIELAKENIMQQMNRRPWTVCRPDSINSVRGDVFQVNKRYTELECGLIKKFYGSICWFIEKTLFTPLRRAKYEVQESEIPTKREPLIMGPVVGLMNYHTSILSQCVFMLKCRLEDGILRGEILAESRGLLVSLLESEITSFNVRIFMLGVVLAGTVLSLFRDLKRYWQRRRSGLFSAGQKVLQLHEPAMEKCCIICYENCRNLIIFDCKHLILCDKCYNDGSMNACPVCKKAITQAIPIYELKPPRN